MLVKNAYLNFVLFFSAEDSWSGKLDRIRILLFLKTNYWSTVS